MADFYKFLDIIKVNNKLVNENNDALKLDEDSPILVCIGDSINIDESMNITDKKYRDAPIILVRSSYEHEQGDTNTTRSRHRAGIKLIAPGYDTQGLEVFTTNKNGEVVATLPDNVEWASKRDRKIATDFIKRYHNEIDIIYNTPPNSLVYKETVLLLKNKIANDKKYIVNRW